MSADDQALEAKLAALYTDPPWRLPLPMPPPATGDSALDALFVDLVGTFQDAGRIEDRKERLGADARPVVRETTVRWCEHIVADRPARTMVGSDETTASIADLDVRTAVQTRMRAAAVAWQLRQWLFGNLLGVLAKAPDEALVTHLLRWLEELKEPALLAHVAGVLILLPAGAARDHALDTLAGRFVPGDPLAPLAAVALVVREGTGALARVKTTFEQMEPYERGATAVQLSRRRAEVDLDACPDWADVLYPGVLGNAWAIEASYRLHTVKTAEPLLRALRHTDVDAYWTDILARLRAVDDPKAAPVLEALAKGLPEQEKGKRLSRTSTTVLALVKRLRRKRDVVDRASFETRPGVGTDGGPIVVLSADVATSWRGVPKDWTGEGDSDYDRACAASEGGVGMLMVAGKRALVIGDQTVGFATLSDGTPMFVVRGTDLQIELGMRERGAWKKTKLALDVGEGGAIVLDAAHTPSSAPEGAHAALDLSAGKYDVALLGTDAVFAFKLALGKAKKS